MKKILILFALIILQLYSLFTFISNCNRNGNFYFSKPVLSLHLDELIHNDIDTPLLVVRFFHNKISLFFLQAFSNYIHFFDPLYLIRIVTLIGLAGILYYYWILSFRKKEHRFLWPLGIFILIVPLVEVFFSNNISPLAKILLLILPIQLVSLIGYFFLLRLQKTMLLSLLLLILSLFFIVQLQLYPGFCLS